MEAIQDTWVIGDEFLKDCEKLLTALAKSASARHTSQPFLCGCFNVKVYYANFATRGLARILNCLVEALNERYKLAKYILVIPDKDIIAQLKSYNIGNGIVMGSAIHFLIRQFDILIERRKLDLLDKKPGAVNSDPLTAPKFIWICMLKCPSYLNNGSNLTFSLRGKFNSILQERLLDGKDDNHRIMSIDIQPDEFDLQGNLTSAGKAEFWKEVNRAMRKFDNNDITLNPRNFNSKAKAAVPESSRDDPKNFVQKVKEEHY